jgi:O-acetylhomoserine/O-acetylserine sulfhydrylase-like pyridoxal-dependent enzyme
MAFTGNWACNTFKTGMMNGTFNFTSGSFKIALYTNAATLDATTTAYTSTGEVVASGYTAGGLALTIAQVPTVGNSGTTAYISFDNAVWTASLTARGALIYQTTTGNPAVCVLDFGADKTSSATFTVQFPDPSNTSAIIRIA